VTGAQGFTYQLRIDSLPNRVGRLSGQTVVHYSLVPSHIILNALVGSVVEFRAAIELLQVSNRFLLNDDPCGSRVNFWRVKTQPNKSTRSEIDFGRNLM
jgi:hypothetical protein